MSDADRLPFQPRASAVLRPRALFGSPGTVVGLRAASASSAGVVRTVSVWLYGEPPAGLVDAALWSLEAGAPTPEVTVVGDGTVVPAGTDPDGNPVPAHLTLPVAATATALPGRAPYRLGLDPAGLAPLGLAVDPLRRYVPVRLRPECGDLPDCLTVPPEPAPLTPPDHDTLARDYAGLRAMLVERLGALDAGADRSPADVTVTLIELMAHLGDLLAYRQDRVATESWLPTARHRASVTRHARLVDFAVPPATSAATTVQVIVRHAASGGTDAAFVVRPGDTATDAVGALRPGEGAHFTLETDADVTVRASHAEVALYDWGESDAVLTAGATSAVLVRPPAADGTPLTTWLPAGSLLGFEVVGPGPVDEHVRWSRRLRTWPPPEDGNQTRAPLASHPAQVVRITGATEMTDPLAPGLPLVRVFWGPADALRRPVPASIDTSAGTPRVGVARLGLLPAHHGLCVDGPDALVPLDPLTGDRPDPTEHQVADYLLPEAGAAGLSCAPGGRPWQLQTRVTLPSGVVVAATRVTSLLRAPAEGFSVTVDHDDDDPPRVRFRTGALGLAPPAGSAVTVRHQVGAGPDGRIAANTLTRLVRSGSPAGQPCTWLTADARVTVRNVTPGTGADPAMPLDTVRRDAPQAYAAVPRRAVLVSDLPPFAVQVPGVARAAARRSWCGSWPVGLVTVETGTVETGTGEPDPTVATAAAEVMEAVRMIGTEVVAVPATPIGLLVAVTVCLAPSTDATLARLQILAALRPGRPDAVFSATTHPLGTSVHVSRVVAAVAGVPGVDAARVTEARRLSEPPGALDAVLVMGPAEIAVCDDDPARPDRGRIELTVQGGR